MILVNSCLRSALLGVALLVSGQAGALTSVGPPPCNFPTIQRAIDAALNAQRAGDFSNPDIIVAGGRFHEALTIDAAGITGARLSIRGGFDATCTGLDPEVATIVDAEALLASAVKISGSIAIQLSSLVITGGSAPAHGGGIDFNGAGSLDLSETDIFGNRAPYGGGIFANGFPPRLTVRLHRNNVIDRNSAVHAGGGIHLSGESRLFMIDTENSDVRTNVITSNAVDVTDPDGAGGGIKIVGPARADIGSGIIFGNAARIGGGIAVDTIGNESGRLRFFQTSTVRPTIVDANSAADLGGGIYVNGGFPQGIVCGFGYRLHGNIARQGSAIHVDSVADEPGGQVLLTEASIDSRSCGPETATSLGAIPCAVGSPCNTIDGNRSETPEGSGTDGATLSFESNAVFRADRLALRDNQGKHLLQGAATFNEGELSMSNCLIAENVVSGNLLRVLERGKLNLRSCTLSGNIIGGPVVFSLTGDFALNESIVWQPGTLILSQEKRAQRDIRYVMASEVASLVVQADVVESDPLFVSPSSSDYHLQPGSPALDFATALPGVDLDGVPRTIDLPGNGAGVLDLGAYERQSPPGLPPDETFDEVAAPALPPNWVSDHAGASIGWMTTTIDAFSAPNAAFTQSTAVVTDKSLETPSFTIVGNGKLTFRHKAILELQDAVTGLDGVVLEIAISPGPFVDIQSAGGVFLEGAYGDVIDACCENPLAGRAAWSRTASGYETVVVDLPESANGKSVRLRWRMGTDYSVGNGGYWLDDVHVELDGPIFASSFETN